MTSQKISPCLKDPLIYKGGVIPYRDLTPSHRFPFVTVILIALNLAGFGWELLQPRPELTSFIFRYAVIPLEFKIGHNLPISMGPPPILTVFTAMFLHGGFLHLFGNMLYLWIFGDNVEDRLGHIRFLCFYFLCGFAATFAQIYADFGSKVPSLGASGAIAGVLGAYLLLFPRGRVMVLVPIFYFLRTVVLPAWLVLGGWILLQLLQAPTQKFGEGGVAFYAHIGGFVTGLLLLPALKRRRRR